jgi:hypothetical protein
MKKNKLLFFSLFIFLLISLRISNEISNGWLGPNASISVRLPKESIKAFSDSLQPSDVILFDDNNYHILKKFDNKKMPITYFKLYLDKIPEISKNNLKGRRALALVNCAFIDEFNLYNKFLVVNTITTFQDKNIKFCISTISER